MSYACIRLEAPIALYGRNNGTGMIDQRRRMIAPLVHSGRMRLVVGKHRAELETVHDGRVGQRQYLIDRLHERVDMGQVKHEWNELERGVSPALRLAATAAATLAADLEASGYQDIGDGREDCGSSLPLTERTTP